MKSSILALLLLVGASVFGGAAVYLAESGSTDASAAFTTLAIATAFVCGVCTQRQQNP